MPRLTPPTLLLLAATLTACGRDTTDPITTPPAVTSVTVSPATLELHPGETSQLAASPRAADGTALPDRPVTWSASAPTIASVSSTGLVTGVAPGGPVTITATSEGKSATAQLTVTPIPVASISISPATASLPAGDTLRLTATTKGASGTPLTGRPISWSSGNPGVATVSTSGLVTGVTTGGPVNITATSEGKSATAQVTIRGATVARIQVTAPGLEVPEGGTMQLTAQLTDAAGNTLQGRAITWTSDSTHIATVDASGLVRTLRAGTTSIRARADNAEGTVSITARGLIHRWTFDEDGGPGTTFRDDIRGTSATLVRGGTLAGAAIAGQVTLTGGAQANADYVALPPRLLRGLPDATIEVWATVHTLRNWSRVLDIGNGPGNNLFVAWSQATNPLSDRTAFTVGGVEQRLDNAIAPFTPDLQHHLILTVDEGGGSGGRTRVSLYLDGVPRGAFEVTYRLRDLLDDHFWLGRSHYADETANASYDEVRIHDRVLSAAEAQQSFLRGPVRTGAPATLAILTPAGIRDTVRGLNVRFPLRVVGRDARGRQFPVPGARWTSSNTGVATVDSTGQVHARTPGRADIVATIGGTSTQWSATVVRMRRVQVDPFLATPAAGALWEVPVVLIEYLPTADGATIDTLKNPDFYVAGAMTLDSAERRILTFAQRRKMGVEQGSRFRGYKDATAVPSLGYRVVEHIIIYEIEPPSPTRRWIGVPGDPRFPDFFQIFADLQLDPLMRARGVREIWLADSGFDASYPSYRAGVHDPADFRVNFESNMSSPTTGDISNSFRDNGDLPVLPHTYIVYGINYRRTQAEALHNVGHQMEAMLGYVAVRQDGNDRLFWRDFVGQDNAGQFITGRTGWTHMPPNTIGNYDYLNATLVPSDIEDWRPDNAGVKKPVNVNTWGALTYPWPGAANFDQRTESQWYVYWWQNFPGRGNTIPHGARWMTNWWAFAGNWDAAITSGLGLHAGTQAAARGAGQPLAFPAPSASRTPPHLERAPSRGVTPARRH